VTAKATSKLVRPGERHVFCGACAKRYNRLMIIHDARGPDGKGPCYGELPTGYREAEGRWVGSSSQRSQGLARGKAVCKALAVPPGSPEEPYAKDALETYTTKRRPAHVQLPPGTYTIICRACGDANEVTI